MSHARYRNQDLNNQVSGQWYLILSIYQHVKCRPRISNLINQVVERSPIPRFAGIKAGWRAMAEVDDLMLNECSMDHNGSIVDKTWIRTSNIFTYIRFRNILKYILTWWTTRGADFRQVKPLVGTKDYGSNVGKISTETMGFARFYHILDRVWCRFPLK